ncbi:hypothetical protein TWF281_008145 [Arthrobotrys megalospora]
MRLLDYIEALRPFYPGLGEDRKWDGTTKAAQTQHCPRLEEWPGFWDDVHGIIRECSGVEVRQASQTNLKIIFGNVWSLKTNIYKVPKQHANASKFRALQTPKTTKGATKLGQQTQQPLLSDLDVANLLQEAVGRPVKNILHSAYGIDATFEDPRSGIQIGDPNRVLCVSEPIQQTKTNEPPITGNKPLVTIEVKPSWVLYLPPNIATIFNRERHLIYSKRKKGQSELTRAIAQMFAHMHINDLSYAILTTYHSAYLFKRIDAKGNFPRLLVSPIVRRGDIGENSMVAAFVGAAVLAFRERRWEEIPRTLDSTLRILDINPGTDHQHLVVDGLGTQPLSGNTGRAARGTAVPPSGVHVQFTEFVSRNLASTFRGVLHVGQLRRNVIFKVYDLSIVEIADVCRDELNAYAALTPIQGTHVPRIWAVGTLYGIYRVIAMQPCGEPVPEPPPPQFYEQAPILFQAIHSHGVVHNDIDLRNFMVSHGHQYWVIDFNSAKIGTPAQIKSEERYLGTLLKKMKKGYIVPLPRKDEEQSDEEPKGQDDNPKPISKL